MAQAVSQSVVPGASAGGPVLPEHIPCGGRRSEGNPLLARAGEVLRSAPARLVLTDGEDSRAVEAALRLRREGLARPVLLGRPGVVRALAREARLRRGGPLPFLEVVDPAAPAVLAANTEAYLELQRAAGKDMEPEAARAFMRTGQAAGAMLVKKGLVEVGVGGNVASTADMLRAGLRILGTAPGSKTVSGFFFMVAPEEHAPEEGRVLVFADGGVIPEPTADQLVDIAVDSARQYRLMTGGEPRVAMLSFSSHGSAKHPRAEFVRSTVERIRQKAPGLSVDGELQFDAAVVPSVADKKVPDSPLGGRANVLVFPSLEAGNISYKIAQRLGGYTAIGPLLQGLAGGWHDLSRGCSADDIYQVALIGSVLQRA